MRRVIALAALASCVAVPAAARAQSKEDIARADALFNAAKALTDAGNYADACAKYAESKRLAPGLGVTLYLADCYEHIGRTASAWTEFLAAEGLARQRNDKRAEVAHQHAQALEPKLDRLTITVAPTVPQAGLSILRDGVPVTREELGLAVPVDPGDHAVVVSAPGHAPRTLDAHVGPESPTATVRIDSLDDTPATTPSSAPGPAPATATTEPAPSGPERPPASADSSKTRRILGFGAIGVGAVGLGVGTVFGFLAKSKLDASNSNGNCDSQDRCTSTGLSDRKDAESFATFSTIGFIAGGVFAAGGVVLFLTAPPPASPSTGLTLMPAPLTGGAGALLRGSF
jgi:serine/threonine-protein kinase